MTTFSQFVDEMVGETKRFDLGPEIGTYINQTVREVHFRSDVGTVLHYRDNLNELQLIATMESGFTWEIPNPAIFQGLVGVLYADQYDFNPGYDSDYRYSVDPATSQGIWAVEVTPSRNMQKYRHSFYRVGNSYAFSGYGTTGSRIKLAYFAYPARLKYYSLATRPASWDDESGWTYLPAYDVDETTRETARRLVTNWLLLRWHDVLAEGVRAKVYKRVSDEVRGRTAYSLYSTLRMGLWTSEIVDLGGPA